MDVFTLKLILTPTLIGMVSWAGRRWGSFISGWLVGLPLTSGPIVLFLALTHGTTFASAAALGILSGTLSQAIVCLVYTRLCETHRWPATLAISLGFFALATVGFNAFRPAVEWLFPLVIAGLIAILRLIPQPRAETTTSRSLPAWDIPTRMIVATLFVVGLTEISQALGPHVTGLLAPFPLYAMILAVFAHHFEGPAAAIRVLRGMLQGLFSFAVFFLIVAQFIERAGTGPAVLSAVVVALALQVAAVWLRRKLGRH